MAALALFMLILTPAAQAQDARCERELGRLRQRLSQQLAGQFSVGQSINESFSAEFERAVTRSRDPSIRRVSGHLARMRRHTAMTTADTERFLQDLRAVAVHVGHWSRLDLMACAEDTQPRALEPTEEWRRTDGAVRGRHYCQRGDERQRPVQVSFVYFLPQDPAHGRSQPVARFCTWFGGSRRVEVPELVREGRNDLYVCSDLDLISGRSRGTDLLGLYDPSTDEAFLAMTGKFPESEARVGGTPLAEYVRDYLRAHASRRCAASVE